MDTTPVDRHTLAAIAPKLAELTETVLFCDIWARSELSPRERSLITLSALTALLGWYRLSCTTCAYFLIGFLMGLVLGPHPPGAAMGHGHYGWAFWGCIYLLSLPMGLLAERAGRKGVTFASRRGRLLAAGLVLCPLLSAVLAALAKAP